MKDEVKEIIHILKTSLSPYFFEEFFLNTFDNKEFVEYCGIDKIERLISILGLKRTQNTFKVNCDKASTNSEISFSLVISNKDESERVILNCKVTRKGCRLEEMLDSLK